MKKKHHQIFNVINQITFFHFFISIKTVKILK